MANSLFKNKKVLIATAIAAAVVAVLLINENNKKNTNNSTRSQNTTAEDSVKQTQFYKAEESKPCISPPLKGINIPYNIATLASEKESTITTPSGSEIIIPANAFTDESGNPVKGEVEIKHREFHNPVDFFVAGIPMAYDSAGTRYHFESAGMIEVTAYQNGKALNIAPEKSIRINLDSKDSNPQHNLYKLDTVKNNWSCLGKDKIIAKKTSQPAAKSAKENIAINSEKKKIEEQKELLTEQRQTQINTLPKVSDEPIKPVKAIEKKYNFNIEVDTEEHPELAVYKNVLFQIGDENKNFNEASYKVIWDDATISDGPKKGENYLLTLKKGVKKYSLIVYPVFEGKNYDAALKTYQDKFAKYNVLLAKRAENEKRIEEEYQNKLAQLKKRELDIQRSFEEEQKREFSRMSAQQKIVRTFAINSFGVYNCDRAMPLPTGVSCVAQLTFENKPLLCYDIFLTEKNRNALFSFYKNPVKDFSYNPQSNNILWTVENGELYWLKPELFNQIKVENGRAIIPMNKINATFKTADEIKTFFGI